MDSLSRIVSQYCSNSEYRRLSELKVHRMRKINLLLLGFTLSGSIAVQAASAQTAPSPAPGLSQPAQPSQTQPSQTKPQPPAETTPAAPTTVPPPVTAPPPETRVDTPKGKKGAVAPVKPPADAKAAFIIGAEDVLAVRVWDEPGLSGTVTVGPDGMISLQLIHEVRAAGLTTSQLEAVLTEQFKQYRNNPDVSVSVMSVRSRKFLIQGGMGRTGTFPLTGPTTVLEALSNGGGFKEFSNRKKIYILRTKPDGTVEKINFNYNEVSHGKKMEQNILIQNGDQIFVPE
jgi:polysaccharide export outer membrane protein